MHEKIFLFITLICIFSVSCTNNTLVEDKTLRFITPVNETGDHCYYQYNENDDALLVLSRDSHIINAYSTSKKTLNYSIPLDSIKYRISGFYFHNEDSVFLLSSYTNYIYLVNSSGNIIKQWSWKFPDDYDAFEIPFINKNMTVEFRCSMRNPLLWYNNMLFTGNASFYPPPYELYDKKLGFAYMKNEFPHLIIDLSRNELKINNKTGKWPDIYQQFECYAPSGDKYSRTINNKGQLIFSYPVDHCIYIYNQNKLLQKVKCKSKYIDKFYPCNYFKFYNDNTYIRQYSVESPGYASIIYDKYRDVYYRVACHRFIAKNKDGTVNSYNNKPWSVMVLGNKYEIIDEMLMNTDKFNYWDMIVTKEGLLIGNNNDQNGKDISFTLFTLTK